MKIKTQEAVMNAIKAVLDAEDQLAAILAAPEPKPGKGKKAGDRVLARASELGLAKSKLDAARHDLRRAYKEAHNELTT